MTGQDGQVVAVDALAPLTVEQRKRARDGNVAAMRDLRSRLVAEGWRPYKASELISPDEQTAVRFGYSSGDSYLEVKRFNPEERAKHVADEAAWWTVTDTCRLGERTVDPQESIETCLRQAGLLQAGSQVPDQETPSLDGLALGMQVARAAAKEAADIEQSWLRLQALLPAHVFERARLDILGRVKRGADLRHTLYDAIGEAAAGNYRPPPQVVVVGVETPSDQAVVPVPLPGLSLGEMQATQPWTAPYSSAYLESRDGMGEQHRDAMHALLHVVKAAGVLASVCEWADHNGPRLDRVTQASWEGRIADLVMNALYLANHPPHGYAAFDLQQAVVDRTERINGRGFTQ